MAPVPAGQPGVPLAGGDRDAPPAGGDGAAGLTATGGSPRRPRRRRLLRGLGIALVAYLAASFALDLALGAGVVGTDAVPDALRAGLAAVALFAVCGFGPVRLLLPDGLRGNEWLWILPVGACACGLAMTVLGFAAVPFHVSLGVVLAAGAVLAVYAWRRMGGGPAGPPRPAALGWPVYLAVLLCAVALVPMFRSGFATVIGNGSDAHLAVGTAQFLQHNYPTAVNPAEPVDRVPLVWRSKQPIYYALGASASLSGLEPYQEISTLAAVLLALAALGWYLVARELLGAGVYAAAAAMAIVGLDRIVLHTGMHPYFNQTWGYMTLPYALVLGWWAIRQRSRGGLALLALFLALGAFAYPLALPIPLTFLLFAWWVDRRARRRAGERIPPWWRSAWRRVYRGRRSLLWLVPLALALLIPIGGVIEKSLTALRVMDPNTSLLAWGGDLQASIPGEQYFGLDFHDGWPLAAAAIAGFGLLALWRRPRPLAAGLAAVMLFGALVGLSFHDRDHGWYFEFKALAFTMPLVVTAGAVGIARLGQLGSGRRHWLAAAASVALLAGFVTIAQRSDKAELKDTYDQLPRTIVGLRDWDRRLPPGRSIRLEVDPGTQLWVAYMLSGQPLCSQRPLLETSYPHVPVSRRADYVLADRTMARPFDAAGPPVLANRAYALYRMRPGVPGPERCSRRMVQTVTGIGAL